MCLSSFVIIFLTRHWKLKQKGYLNHILFVWTKGLNLSKRNLVWHKRQYESRDTVWHAIHNKPKRLRLMQCMNILEDSASANTRQCIFYVYSTWSGSHVPLLGFGKNFTSVLPPRPNRWCISSWARLHFKQPCPLQAYVSVYTVSGS
jgi:hypothetical protein